MRKLKFLVIGLCALFVTNVSALEVNDFDTVGTVKGLKDCLLTESTCTLTGNITVDEEGFKLKFKEHQEKSRAGSIVSSIGNP